MNGIHAPSEIKREKLKVNTGRLFSQYSHGNIF